MPSTNISETSGPSSVERIQSVAATLQRLVDFRRPYDVRRSLFYRQYLGQRDGIMFPDGVTPRSNTAAKIPWSNVETVVSRVHDAYFGYEDWFEAKGRGEQDGDAAEKMQITLQYLLKQSQLTQAFEDLARTIAIYGHGGIKVEWDFGFDTESIKVPTMGPNGQPTFKQQTVPIPKNRFKFTPIDIYDLVVDPDGLYIGMLADKTYEQLVREAVGYSQAYPDAPPLYDPKALSQLADKLNSYKEPEKVIIRIAEVWDKVANSVTLMTARDPDAIAWKDRRASYRFSTYSSFRAPVYNGESLLLYDGPNPFNHKQCPILHTGYVRLPNECYGIGVVEPTNEEVEALSKFINMIVDNWNLGINRRYAYDVNANIDHEALNKFNTPGGKVAVEGDPSKVIYPLPFFSPEGGDYQLLELYQKLIENTSSISDFYNRGVGGPQGNETATGISQVIGESNYKFRMFIRNLELYVMQPLLQQCASLIQQYLPDKIEVLITDAQPAIPKYQSIAPEELIGNYSFDLVAANYVTNKVVRQRNLMAFVNVVGTSPYWNIYEGLKVLGKAFEIPNLNRLLKTPDQVAQEAQANQQQQLQMQEMLANQEQARENEQILLKSAVGVHEATKKSEADAKHGEHGGSRDGAGRKSKAQFEGKIPGAGITSPVRDVAQNSGANSIGLGGMGEAGIGM